MNTIEVRIARDAIGHFGARVAQRLSAGTEQLPYDITERLRAARVRAVAQRRAEVRRQPAHTVVAAGSTAALGGGDDRLGLWGRIGSALPLLVLAAGLVLIHGFLSERRASELAEVDTALLTDDLPPSAYADPGFTQFLKSGRN